MAFTPCEHLRVLQIAWDVTIGICIKVPIKQIFVRREVIVSRTRLKDLDEGKAADVLAKDALSSSSQNAT
jgi:hypothetical protein